jgi:diadenosine tetraphosphatase ApaH/serine/threonine PP2A family protein phosphatase
MLMNDDLSARQRAITLRLGGRSVPHIGRALGRSEAWVHKWWRRYLDVGAEELDDRTRAHSNVASRIPPELERAIRSIRRQREARTGRGARYRLRGASASLAERPALHVQPRPSLRTIDRVRQRNGSTFPRRRRPRLLPRQL